MKKYIIIAVVLLISANLLAQESRLEIIPKSIFVLGSIDRQQLPNPEITKLLDGKFSCSTTGFPIQKINSTDSFKIYTLDNRNWVMQQDMYNSIIANVPNVQIRNMNSNQAPNIKMRGTQNTIVLVDGVRYDVSILNALNPADIESVRLSNNPSAEVYFRFR
jgi:hypothetical protein